MREIRRRERLGPSTSSIIEEAESRGIPWIRLNKYSLCQLGQGVNIKRIQATVTSETSNIGVELASDKTNTKELLSQAGIRVPPGENISELDELAEACRRLGFPLVIKPIDGNHGRGVTVNIQNYANAVVAFHLASTISENIIVEKYIVGDDYRLLVIDNKFVAAAKRTPAYIIGNGVLTIQQLIDTVNKDPRRGYGHENVLTLIKVDGLTKKLLKKRGYTLKSVLPNDEILVLKNTANLSTGGTSEDVTDMVHPEIMSMAMRVSRIIDLDICGIDLITADISKPLEETEGVVIEVNAGPGFRMHLAPTKGMARNVASPVIDKLFPHGATGRIPIVAITGTNGKTTTTRLIAHIAKLNGKCVGYTTSDGVYIHNRRLVTGDCTGPESTTFVLKDRTVDFAVLECARGGLLRAGLGFKKCDIGIVTNLSADHLGLNGIHTIEQLARVKSVIPETVMPSGFAILNAEDDLVYDMRRNISCNLALFSMDENNTRIKKLQAKGGITAVYENGYVTLCRGHLKMRVAKASNIPLTHGGNARFMINNILPAILVGFIQGINIPDIKIALKTFIPSFSLTPGRLNIFNFKNFTFLLDYAHNPAGMLALKQFIETFDATPKVGIIAGIGDRRESDNQEIGSIAAQMYDEIIIRHDKDLRGKTKEELNQMLLDGVKMHKENMKITVVSSELDAIKYAIDNAVSGSLIVLSSDAVSEAIALVVKLREEEIQNEKRYLNEE